MRLVVLALMAAAGLVAYAVEPIEIEPRVRVPGERPKLTVSESLLQALDMSPDDIKAVKAEVERLNAQRATLMKAVEDAQAELRAAQRKVDEAVAALKKQEQDLAKFIRARLAQDRAAEYDVRMRLQPVVDWLKLTEDQVSQLVAKQTALLANDPRPRLAQETDAILSRTEPLTAEQRKQHIQLLRECKAFEDRWLANIESVLTPEQKQAWRARYRRTGLPIGGGAAPAPGQ